MNTVQPIIEVICVGPQTDSLTCLMRAHTAGLTMAVAASLLSLASVLYAFLFIAISNWHTSTGFRIFYNPMDVLVFALLFADLVQAIGGFLSLKWIRDGVVQTGVFCTAQGILKTLGETGDGLTAMLIAIYTFVGVSTGRNLQSKKITVALIVGIWVFIGIMIGGGHAATRGPYMRPTPYWCWIGANTTWKIMGDYLWLWISLFVSCLLYIPLFLWMRGVLVFHKWFVWSFRSAVPDPNIRSIRRKALVMLVYPIVYCICIVPLSIIRWMTFHKTTSVRPECTFTVTTIFGLSGFLNVILILITKPNLGLFGRHEETSSGRPPSRSAINQSRPETASDIDLATARLPSQADPNMQRARSHNELA